MVRETAKCIHKVCCTSSHSPYLYDLQSFKLLAERGGRHWLESMALQLLWWILSSPPACQTPWDIIVLSHSCRPGLGFILLTDILWIKQALVCSETKTPMIWLHCLHELILLLCLTSPGFILNLCVLLCISMEVQGVLLWHLWTTIANAYFLLLVMWCCLFLFFSSP